MALAVRGFNPIWFEVDLTAHPFDDTFYLFTLQNTIPYQPQTVWHDQNMNSPWTDPSLIYRLEFRQGPTQNDPLIYEVDNYQVNGSGGITPPSAISFNSENQITNPQFSEINFITPYSLTATNPVPFEVAPGWFLNLVGTGSVTVTQIPLNSTTPNPTNAPYALEINTSGSWTNVQLYQRFQQNGLLWANKIVSSSVTARVNGASQNITATLVDSNSTLLATVLRTAPVSTSFNEYKDYGQLGDSSDTDLPPVAYIDYILQLQNSTDIFLTSFQLSVQDLPVTLSFIQDSINRQIDHTFNYWKPRLDFKAISSLLAGWDFPLNPAQFGSSKTVNTTPTYIWDQTIMASATGNVAITRDAIQGGMKAVNASATEAFYCLQYLDGLQVKKIIGNRLSVNINAYTNGANNVTARINLFVGNSSATVPSLTGITPTTIGSIANTGIFTNNSGPNWTEIPRGLFGQAYGNLAVVTSSANINNGNDLQFSFWDLNPTQISDTQLFAMVVSFQVPTISTQVFINSISLVPGDIPTRPAPKTTDEVLRECQYYFEVTAEYAEEMLINPSPYLTGAQTLALVSRIFNVDYQKKRAVPVLAIQSPISGSPNLVNGVLFNNGATVKNQDIAIGNATAGWTNWTPTVLTVNSAVFEPQNVNGLISMGVASALWPEAYITYIAIADARLGVV
jgi:hypothetical protein